MTTATPRKKDYSRMSIIMAELGAGIPCRDASSIPLDDYYSDKINALIHDGNVYYIECADVFKKNSSIFINTPENRALLSVFTGSPEDPIRASGWARVHDDDFLIRLTKGNSGKDYVLFGDINQIQTLADMLKGSIYDNICQERVHWYGEDFDKHLKKLSARNFDLTSKAPEFINKSDIDIIAARLNGIYINADRKVSDNITVIEKPLRYSDLYKYSNPGEMIMNPFSEEGNLKFLQFVNIGSDYMMPELKNIGRVDNGQFYFQFSRKLRNPDIASDEYPDIISCSTLVNKLNLEDFLDLYSNKFAKPDIEKLSVEKGKVIEKAIQAADSFAEDHNFSFDSIAFFGNKNFHFKNLRVYEHKNGDHEYFKKDGFVNKHIDETVFLLSDEFKMERDCVNYCDKIFEQADETIKNMDKVIKNFKLLKDMPEKTKTEKEER